MGSWMLLFSDVVPISLIVTVESTNFIQSLMIFKDEDMYHIEKDNDGKTVYNNAVVHNSLLIEDLGKVNTIFSDKTGTLTRNEMKFSQLYLDG